jgi:hypothetical protein
VFFTHASLGDGSEDWLVIESPFAKVGEVDLERLLVALEPSICGGLATIEGGRTLVLRHAVPLANIDLNELIRPMELLTGQADAFEDDISQGQDRF